MLYAIQGVKLYANCYTSSEALNMKKRHAHCYTWSEALCSMPCNSEAICSLLYME